MIKVLFLCTANSCRSILSEAIFNELAPSGMHAFSAGSIPKGEIHPLTLKALQRAGVATDQLFSKPIEFHEELSPDFVITVCDKAAGEACPAYFGSAIKAHWGLSDPSDLQGDPALVDAAFDRTLAIIRERVQAFFALNLGTLNADQMKHEMARIATLGTGA